jgi:heme-degrading monooxygenase HmoA
MFARNVSIKLKSDSFQEFNKAFESEIVPMLKKQPGFRDELTLTGDDKAYITAISLWDTKENAEAYEKSAYPTVLKTLDKFIDGAPKVRPSNVVSSTLHQKLATA